MRERREEVAVLCATLRALSPDLLPVGKEEELLWALEVASSRAIGETNMNGTAATMASPVTPAPAAGVPADGIGAGAVARHVQPRRGRAAVAALQQRRHELQLFHPKPALVQGRGGAALPPVPAPFLPSIFQPISTSLIIAPNNLKIVPPQQFLCRAAAKCLRSSHQRRRARHAISPVAAGRCACPTGRRATTCWR